MDKSPAPTPATTSERYFFQVLKTGEKPTWPRPEEDLVVGTAELAGDLVQYWAYPKDLAKEADELPPAEVLASENPTPKPAILVDQPRTPASDDEAVLELVLVKDNHALARSSSSISGLEASLTSLLRDAGTKFNIQVGHFMTTDRVSEEVEKKLDSLEEKEGVGEVADPPPVPAPVESVVPPPPPIQNFDPPPTPTTEPLPQPPRPEDIGMEPAPIRPVQSQIPSSGIYASSRPSRGSNFGPLLKWGVILLVILALAGGLFFFRDQVLAKVKSLTGGGDKPATDTAATPTPAPTETPTPTPDIDRTKFKVRVLNGTAKAGAASSLGDELKALGWGIDKVGNNPDQEVKKGYVRSKEGLSEDATKVLVADLGEGFEATGSALTKTDKADLEVVIGGE